MKRIIPFIFLSAVIFSKVSAQNLNCPADVEVKFVDLDPNLDYGIPDVLINQPYNLTVSNLYENLGCDENYFEVYTKTWTLSYGNSTETCQQLISVTANSFQDYTAPSDTTLVSGDPNDISPDITGYYGPKLGNGGVISAAYSDLVIPHNSGAKIIRQWVLLDWCSAATLEHNQLITIGSATGNSLSVKTPKGEDVGNYSFELYDSEGNIISNPNCSGNIVDMINCAYVADMDIESIELRFGDPGDYLNGVSTLDLVLVQRHILGIKTLDSPYALIAADVNSSDKISAFDLIQMKKVILGITSAFPNSPSWKYVNEDINEGLIFTNDKLPLNALSIIAIKVGDVNCTAK